MTIYNRDNICGEAGILADFFMEAPQRVSNDIMPYTSVGGPYQEQALEEAVDRVRTQILGLIGVCRAWKVRHAGLTGEIEVRYSAYEGMLCFQDLRRYWALYRHASRELRCVSAAQPLRVVA